MLAHRLEGYGTLGQLWGELSEDELVGLYCSRRIEPEGLSRVTCIALYLSQSLARDPRDGLSNGIARTAEAFSAFGQSGIALNTSMT